MTQNDQAAMNEQLTQLRLQGLSIDGDNRYKQDLIDAIIGAMMFGAQGANPPPAGHWLEQFYVIAREERDALARVEAEHATWMEQYDSVVRYGNELLIERDTAQAQLEEAVGLGKTLHSACVNLLYGGYDRITELGGDCDPVSKMEAENPAMQEWKAFLARHAQAEQQEAKPATFYDAIKNPPRIAPTLQQEARHAQAGDEREAFEKWAKDCSWFDPRPSTKERDDSLFFYEDAITDHNWIAWKARAALATQPAEWADQLYTQGFDAGAAASKRLNTVRGAEHE